MGSALRLPICHNARIENAEERLDKSGATAQIPRITWHGLRHTFSSWLAMAGAATREIMEAAGHKTMTQAARYAHLSSQHTQSGVDWIVVGPPETSNMHQNMHPPGNRGKRSKINKAAT